MTKMAQNNLFFIVRYMNGAFGFTGNGLAALFTLRNQLFHGKFFV